MKNPFQNKFVVNFHHADFDGAISGACVKAALGENVINKAYGIAKVGDAVIKIVDDADMVLLTDISVFDDHLEELFNHIKSNKIVIYDHHSNPHSELIFAELGDQSFSILDPDVCGATLTWLQMTSFFSNNQKLKDLEQIVYLSDVYDMWRLDNPDFEYAATVNNLLDYKIGYNPDQFRDRFLKNPDPYTFTADEQMIIDRKNLKHTENLKIMERSAAIFDYKDRVFVMVEADATDYTKMHFMNAVLESEQIDMFIFKYTGGTQCSVRLPDGSRIKDLNEWYDDFGCAGHSKAGGIQKDEYPKLKKILEQI